MKWLVYALLTLIVSVGVGLFALPDPGYILIGYGKYSVETTLVMLVAVLSIIYFLIRGLAYLWHVPGKVGHWNAERLVTKDIKLLNKGMGQLIEGNAANAERELIRLTSKNGKPLITYIAAARAAQQQGSTIRRDEYLALAHKALPDSAIAIDLSKAELQFSDGQYDQTLKTLTQLRTKAPQHAQVIKMLIAVYRQIGDWASLRELLPAAKKRRILDEGDYQRLCSDSIRALMDVASSATSSELGDLQALQLLWKSLSKEEKQDPALVNLYAQKLIQAGANSDAEQLITNSLKSHWDSRLAGLFGQLKPEDPAKQLVTAESWLNQHPQDPVLLLSCAKLSISNQLWGKARSYIEASISLNPTPESYQLLGILSEKTDNVDLALEAYRQGMKLISTSGNIHSEAKRLDNLS